jgi:WS/DGAT/MGAT family acyltransferase
MGKKLSFFDQMFWITENKHSPKHVAGFQILTPPEHADADYCKNLVDEIKTFDDAFFPFNSRVISFLGFPITFKKVPKLDMDYHIQYHKIDDVDDQKELNKYVAKIHEPMLDRSKPLWQLHVIEGKPGGKIAMYFTIHHIYGDGASLVKWFQQSYKDKPDDTLLPVWAMERKRRKRPSKNKFVSFFVDIWHFFVTVFDVLFILFRLLMKLVRVYPLYMPLPFSGTKTVLTGQVKQGRVVATTSIDFEEIKQLSARMRASVNEILLCSFDIGIHKFLKEGGQKFDRPLITQMPINMRRPQDPPGGNKIAIVPVELAHGENDPYLRLRQIVENHRVVKKVARNVYPAAFTYYTVIIQGVALIMETLRVSSWFRPIGNILISNVPGPKDTRYFKDAKLEAIYPISTLAPGGGVNITLLTYGDKAHIGLVCSDKNIKSLESMAVYFNDAFELLKRSVDDPNVSIEDLAEITEPQKSIIVEAPYHDTMDLDDDLLS